MCVECVLNVRRMGSTSEMHACARRGAEQHICMKGASCCVRRVLGRSVRVFKDSRTWLGSVVRKGNKKNTLHPARVEDTDADALGTSRALIYRVVKWHQIESGCRRCTLRADQPSSAISEFGEK